MKYYESFREQNCYTVEGVLDYFNKRIRVDHYTGNVESIIQTIDELAKKHSFTKCIIRKGRACFNMALFRFCWKQRYLIIFRTRCILFVKYNNDERRNSMHWIEEDTILSGVKGKEIKEKVVPEKFLLRKVFVMETLSVIIQVISFKTTGKRVFKMSPLHHHYELCGWSEWRVVVTFWSAGFLLAVLGIYIGVWM